MFNIQENKFVNLCVDGQYRIEDVDDFIDQWHEGASENDLHEFLGMSWDEYASWVTNPSVLPCVIKARKKAYSKILQEKSAAFG